MPCLSLRMSRRVALVLVLLGIVARGASAAAPVRVSLVRPVPPAVAGQAWIAKLAVRPRSFRGTAGWQPPVRAVSPLLRRAAAAPTGHDSFSRNQGAGLSQRALGAPPRDSAQSRCERPRGHRSSCPSQRASTSSRAERCSSSRTAPAASCASTRPREPSWFSRLRWSGRMPWRARRRARSSSRGATSCVGSSTTRAGSWPARCRESHRSVARARRKQRRTGAEQIVRSGCAEVGGVTQEIRLDARPGCTTGTAA